MTKKSGQPSNDTADKNKSADALEDRRLFKIVEKSQVPFGESASIYTKIKSRIDTDIPLSSEEHEQLVRLVKIAKDWEKGVQSSARTEPEETLAG